MRNPYAPPELDFASSSDGGQLSEPVVIEIVMDAPYLIEATERTRRRDPFRKLWMFARWPCAAFLLVTSALLAVNAHWSYGFGFAAFTIGSFFAYRVDDMYYIWTMKRSGWLNAECRISMSDAGYRVESRGFDMTVPWSSFRCADIFDDGLLFFQTPRSSPWIPWAVVSSLDDRARLLAFVRKSFAANVRRKLVQH